MRRIEHTTELLGVRSSEALAAELADDDLDTLDPRPSGRITYVIQSHGVI